VDSVANPSLRTGDSVANPSPRTGDAVANHSRRSFSEILGISENVWPEMRQSLKKLSKINRA
jgi:hypothetical protein